MSGVLGEIKDLAFAAERIIFDEDFWRWIGRDALDKELSQIVVAFLFRGIFEMFDANNLTDS